MGDVRVFTREILLADEENAPDVPPAAFLLFLPPSLCPPAPSANSRFLFSAPLHFCHCKTSAADEENEKRGKGGKRRERTGRRRGSPNERRRECREGGGGGKGALGGSDPRAASLHRDVAAPAMGPYTETLRTCTRKEFMGKLCFGGRKGGATSLFINRKPVK